MISQFFLIIRVYSEVCKNMDLETHFIQYTDFYKWFTSWFIHDPFVIAYLLKLFSSSVSISRTTSLSLIIFLTILIPDVYGLTMPLDFFTTSFLHSSAFVPSCLYILIT